ncbi:MAG: hypothetical protein M1812_002420 [Candelaria pacifica]|nr:MAG: hypothetical protein M1812_002420 [Candelaria pacifica]
MSVGKTPDAQDDYLAGQAQPETIEGLTSDIFDDCLHNIIHDIVLKVHREEKILRMQSAAIIAEHAAEAAAARAAASTGTSPDSTDVLKSPSTPLANGSTGSAESGLKITTPGAIYEDGKIFLTGNPLATTKEIYCHKCRLPRLLYPTTGIGARTPDPEKEYCAKHPYITKPGHDIYGNPFPSHNAKLPKKRKKGREAQRESSPAGLESSASSPAEFETPGKAAAKTGGGTPFPDVECPICNKSIVITMVAKHLEKCLGIGGRQSSRNAMARMNSQKGNCATPLSSKSGSPARGKRTRQESDDEEDDDDFEETPRKKRKPALPKSTVKKRPTTTK